MSEATEPTDLDGIVCRRDSRLKPQTAFMPAAESEFTDLLCAAKCRARADYAPIKKNASGNYGRYASLDEVLDAVTPALAKHGLDLASKTIIVGDEQWLVSTLRHTSGQFERAFSRLTERQPQKVLSEVTYYRRKDAACLCGVAADSDLDGAGLDGPKAKSNAALSLARQALVAARTEQDRDTVLAKAALSAAAGRMTEDELMGLRRDREAMKPFPKPKEVASAQ
jgi:hypothetical protein